MVYFSNLLLKCRVGGCAMQLVKQCNKKYNFQLSRVDYNNYILCKHLVNGMSISNIKFVIFKSGCCQLCFENRDQEPILLSC